MSREFNQLLTAWRFFDYFERFSLQHAYFHFLIPLKLWLGLLPIHSRIGYIFLLYPSDLARGQ